MDCIVFSANPRIAKMSDAIGHLERNEKLYFEVKFRIRKTQFSFPMNGLIHISGDKIRYKVRIVDILPFSREHYEDPSVAEAVKPSVWLKEWQENMNDLQSQPWKHAIVITRIVPFEYDTHLLVSHPPQSYVKVSPLSEWDGTKNQ